MKNMEEVVAAGVQHQANLDKYLTKAYNSAIALVNVTEKGVELGMLNKAIAAKQIISEAREVPGIIARAASAAANLHAKQTKICQDNGVDTPAPGSAGGVTIQGGGGR